ncbi:LysR substrate-binding domain-containing protein, partial [Pseudomonas fluorescens]|uniref:LysR substrate-binding domain-containing protein n=1 Tax=Pseudomonas fluorescens TaxID=294 RepID=UPI0012BA28F2
ASLMVSSGVLHDVMNTLRSRSPAARLDIVVNHGQHLCQLLVDDDLEFFIANADIWANDIRFAITPLTPRPASIFCSADHPLVHNKEPITSTLLLNYPWAFINLTATTENHIRHLLNLAENTALPIGLNCNDFNLLRHATLKSNYLLFTWNDWLADDLKEGVIVDLKYQLTPELPQEIFYLNYAIVQVAGKTLSPIAQRAITLIQEFAQKPIPADPAS